MSHSDSAIAPACDGTMLQGFYDVLSHADWSYQYSESVAAWNAGRDQITALRRRAEASGVEFMQLFEAFNAWSHDSGPKPLRP